MKLRKNKNVKKITKEAEAMHFKNLNENVLKKESTENGYENKWLYTERECVSCWKIPFWQRIKLVFHGNIWLYALSGSMQPPIKLQCKKSIF